MSQKVKFSLAGTLLLLALFFIMFGAFVGAGLTTSTMDPFGVIILLIVYYLTPGLVLGFIGLYIFFGASEQ